MQHYATNALRPQAVSFDVRLINRQDQEQSYSKDNDKLTYVENLREIKRQRTLVSKEV